jgi:2-oxoglutarate ferredoxin oxidoreductase subunit beta
MTGGQMAPTTLIGQKTTTSVYGRTVEQAGLPLRMCEILSQIDCAVFVERVMLNNPANVRKAKAAVKKALDIQDARLGFTFVEFLSSCPTNWGLAPKDALTFVEKNMAEYYPIRNFKTPEGF